MLGLRIFLQCLSHILFLATEVMVRGTFSPSPNVAMWEPLLPGVNGFEVTCLAFLCAHPSLLTWGEEMIYLTSKSGREN